MTKILQAVRGMNDILPDQIPGWHFVEAKCREICACYGYQEIRTPIIEQTALFARGIGDATDIVEKEMYTFTDRNGDSLSLRPESTAGCVRAGIQHSLFYNQTQRLWYSGPMFRHERPQKGRYRQFYQFGVEAYGMPGPGIDAEVILLGQRLLNELGLSGKIELQLNCLGTTASRSLYREQLVAFYQQHYDLLDQDSQRRLLSNPLRILDSKNPIIIELNRAAPSLLEHLDPPALHHFEGLKKLLTSTGVDFTINPRLVRGIDYYELTVFEWVTTDLGSQGTVCAGGRYNHLVEELGGRPTPAVGFACGLERLVLLMAEKWKQASHPDIYLVLMDEALDYGVGLSERLRSALPNHKIICHLAGGSLKSQLKAAENSGASWAIIVGQAELSLQAVTVKNLVARSQEQVAFTSIIDYFKHPSKVAEA
ncbi:MAG: histidine--tRNA ligase [Proteobacteria bacterium]|nr:histidine--tRNA ligase [Pseudomonadota bacterium]